MLWVIALLVATILITLLGVWGVIPGILAGIVGFVLWLLLAGAAGYAFGGWGVWTVLALPFVAMVGASMYLMAKGEIDVWGNPTSPPPNDRIKLGVEAAVKRHSWRDKTPERD